MSMQLLEVFDFIKQKSELEKSDIEDAKNVLTRFVKEGVANPIDSFVLMDFMEKVFSGAKAEVREETLKHLFASGDFVGYGREMIVKTTSTPDYGFDKSWSKLNDQIKVLRDIQKKREADIKVSVLSAEAENKKPPVPVTEKTTVYPNWNK